MAGKWEPSAGNGVNAVRADMPGASDASRGTRRIGSVRKAVKIVVFLLVVAGLFAGIGWGSYSSMGVDAIAYLCPLGALEALLAAKSAIPRLAIAIVVMAVLVALFGRAFCAWACPVPPVEAFFHPREKAGSGNVLEVPVTAESAAPSPLTDEERSLLAAGCGADAECGAGMACASCLAPVGGARDGLRIDARHGVLLGALAGAAVFGFPVFCLVCPVGLAIATVVAVWQALVGHAPSWSLLVFPLILAVELVVFRKWCHALCPLGVLMSLVGQRSLFKPCVNEARCLRSRGVDCRACVSACSEWLDPHSARLSECTKCGACVDACPAHAIAMPAFSRKKEEERSVSRKGR